jgi:hypothetical protein
MDGLLQIGIDVCHSENQVHITVSEGLTRILWLTRSNFTFLLRYIKCYICAIKADLGM